MPARQTKQRRTHTGNANHFCNAKGCGGSLALALNARGFRASEARPPRHPSQISIKGTMRSFNGSRYQDRQTAAADARKALIEKFQQRPGQDDPAVQARAAERQAILEARKIREAERAERKAREDAERAALHARQEAERIAREAEEARVREEERVRMEAEEARKREEDAQLKIMLEAEKKAERDARYAARKVRKAERRTMLERMW